MSSNHVSIDLETLGTTPGSVIVSIGAVMFDPTLPFDVQETPTYYINIERESSKAHGLTMDAGTVAWWNKQSPEAIEHLKEDQRPVDECLRDFAQWFRNNAGKYPWGHGAAFDLALLAAAYRAVGQKEPWGFFNERDTRTLFHVSDVSVKRAEGTHHYALDDAKAQADAVCRAWAKYIQLTPVE